MAIKKLTIRLKNKISTTHKLKKKLKKNHVLDWPDHRHNTKNQKTYIENS